MSHLTGIVAPVGFQRFPDDDGVPKFSAMSLVTVSVNRIYVSVYRPPHRHSCRALYVQKVVCSPAAWHLRHPVNGDN